MFACQVVIEVSSADLTLADLREPFEIKEGA